MDYDAEWAQELEVLESILTPEELEKQEDKAVVIQVKPVDAAHESIQLSLTVKRTPTYPEEAPEIEIRQNEAAPQDADAGEGEGEGSGIQLTEEDLSKLQVKVEEEAQANLGMAMCFQLQSILSETISLLLVEKAMEEENQRVLAQVREEEAEAERTRGTPVTPETFEVWRAGFIKEVRAQQKAKLADAIKALNAKEKEERKKWDSRLTGKELFEGTDLSKLEQAEDDDAGAVDFSQYRKEDRQRRDDADEEEGGVVLSDSD